MLMGAGPKGAKRVIRGGSWANSAQNVRAAYRNANEPANRNSNLGFRLARAHERVGDPFLTRPSSGPWAPGPAANSEGRAGVLVARAGARSKARRRRRSGAMLSRS